MAILEPWVMLRLLAGAFSMVLFLGASVTAVRVLRHFNVSRATEGQLALERRMELARTFVRVGAVTQVASLVLTVLAADKLSSVVRGAMCAYGVFSANVWGFRALATSLVAAGAAGVLLQLFAFDARIKSMDLVRPLAVGILLTAPLVLLDGATTTRFLLSLDLGVTASCCSVRLDSAAATVASYVEGPRHLATGAGLFFVVSSIGVSALVARRPKATWIVLSGLLTLVALPAAVAATVLEVAPFAFEAPRHTCPFCLLHGDVWGLGYWIFGSTFAAAIWGLGSATGALAARGDAARSALPAFAKTALQKEAGAWALVVLLGAAPVIRYALLTHGADLFR